MQFLTRHLAHFSSSMDEALRTTAAIDSIQAGQLPKENVLYLGPVVSFSRQK
jgi:hypothetical protein